MLERFEEIFREKILPLEREHLRMSKPEIIMKYGTLFGPIALKVIQQEKRKLLQNRWTIGGIPFGKPVEASPD